MNMNIPMQCVCIMVGLGFIYRVAAMEVDPRGPFDSCVFIFGRNLSDEIYTPATRRAHTLAGNPMITSTRT